MGQLGFFDADRRLAALSEKGDPLEAITALVPWESFRAEIEAVALTPDEAKKSKAGRKPFDAIMMFRMLVLQSLYNLSDVQIEYQVWDRATFTRFVGLGSEDCIPDGTTLWLFREKLARAGLIETLFDRFDQHLTAKGYIARGGQMVDASIVPMPKQRNTREENEAVKRGETPAEWERKPAKNRQKDKDARWTKKHGRSFFGYKNHVNVDRTHKLIRRYAVTDAAVHDSRKLNGLLHQGNTSHDVFGDSAYRSAANEATLKGRGFRSRASMCARRAAIRCRRLKRQRTGRRAASARVSSMCSAPRRSRRAAGCCAPSASCGRGSRSACRTSSTTFAGWRRSNAGGLTRSNWRADWLPLEGGARPPRRKKPAAGSKYAPLHKSVQRPIADLR